MPESVRRTVSLSFPLSVLFLPWPVHAHALGLASSLPTGEQSSATLTSTPGQIDAGRRPATLRGRLPQPAFVDNQGQVDERAGLFMLPTICSAQSLHKWLS